MTGGRISDVVFDARLQNLKLLNEARCCVGRAVITLASSRPTEAVVHLAQAQQALLSLERELAP